METSESIDNIIAAIAKAKTELVRPAKSGVNPHFKSTYVTLDDLLISLEKVLAPNGLV